MNRTLLVTGYDTALGRAIADAAQRNSYAVATTVDPGYKRQEQADTPIVVEWNRKVLLSAQNVLLNSANTLNGVNEVIVTFDLAGASTATLAPVHELTNLVLDSEIDRTLKSQIFLLKETLKYFAHHAGERPLGLSFIMAGAGLEVLSPLQALTAGAFMRLVQSCFSLYQNEPYTLRGFHTGSDDAAGFGTFIVESITAGARDGRWYRYTGTPFPELRFPRK